eukprot:938448-Pyramimonas_sp.AAC.1
MKTASGNPKMPPSLRPPSARSPEPPRPFDTRFSQNSRPSGLVLRSHFIRRSAANFRPARPFVP